MHEIKARLIGLGLAIESPVAAGNRGQVVGLGRFLNSVAITDNTIAPATRRPRGPAIPLPSPAAHHEDPAP